MMDYFHFLFIIIVYYQYDGSEITLLEYFHCILFSCHKLCLM